jgi:hypothetical protein
VNAIDPRDYDGRQLIAHLVFGDLPRRGWPGRNRELAKRLVLVAALLVFIVVLLVIACAAITLIWAMGLHR